MQDLELRNVNNIFNKQDKKRKYSVYHDPINNNIIVFVNKYHFVLLF